MKMRKLNPVVSDHDLMLPEAASQLGISPNTLLVKIRREEVRAYQRGKFWFITPAEVYRLEQRGIRKYHKQTHKDQDQTPPLSAS